LHELLHLAEQAIINRNEAVFWSAVGDQVEAAWMAGRSDDPWRMVKLLIDVWTDAGTQREFCQRLDAQLERWIQLIEKAKELGWIHEKVDASSLMALYWSAAIGQPIINNSRFVANSSIGARIAFLESSRVPTVAVTDHP
jgi:hypothetical protein